MWVVDVFVSNCVGSLMVVVGRGCTLSAEKKFQCRSAESLFVSVGLFGLLHGVLGSVSAVSGCASMLVSVTFNVGMRGVWMLQENGF